MKLMGSNYFRGLDGRVKVGGCRMWMKAGDLQPGVCDGMRVERYQLVW